MTLSFKVYVFFAAVLFCGICTFQVVLCGETKLLLPKKPG